MTVIQINPEILSAREARVKQLVSGLQRAVVPNGRETEPGWKVEVNREPKIETCGDSIYVAANMSMKYLAEWAIYWDRERREVYPFISKTSERASGLHAVATTGLYIMAEEPGIYAQVKSLFVGDPNQGFGSSYGAHLQEGQVLDIAKGYNQMIKFLRENSVEEPMPNDSGRLFVLSP